MAEIGQDARALIARAPPPYWFALAALVVACAGALWMWPFTVDDALISVRYARRLALGAGYRFNAGGPATDGVTPLPWPFLLALFARAAPLTVLLRAKVLGLAVWLGAAAAWGRGVGRADAATWAKLVAVTGLAASLPVAAYAVSGMETPVAVALATVAALSHARPRAAAATAGLAAAFRPELGPWALTLAATLAALAPGRTAARVAEAAGLALLPFAACVAVRVAWFGAPAPLALSAKPSDLSHGLAYAGAAALVSVGPVLAFTPVAAFRQRGPGLAIVAAGAVHLMAVAVVGGDWMPFARLVAPVVPALLYAFVLVSRAASVPLALSRAAIALALGIGAFMTASLSTRTVGPDRERLAARAAPLLAGQPRVAALDIGWVSAATDADIIDLAGLTDPEIAALGGGHTSKRVDGALLLARGATALVLYAPRTDLPLDSWSEAPFTRVVEARLARDPVIRDHFGALGYEPLGDTGAGYYILVRRARNP